MKQYKFSDPRINAYILAVLVIVAVTFISVGAGLLYFTNDFSRNAVAVSGTVTSVSANHRASKVVISYVDIEGNAQTGQTFLSYSRKVFPRSSKVDILYDTRSPSDIRIDSRFALWGFPLGFLGGGLLLAVIAIIVALSLKKRKPDAGRGASRRQKQPATYS